MPEKMIPSRTFRPPLWVMSIIWGFAIFIIAYPVYKGFFWNEDFIHLYVAKNLFGDLTVALKSSPMFFRPSLDLFLAIFYKITGPSYTGHILMMHILFLIVSILGYKLLNHIIKHPIVSFTGIFIFILCSLYNDITYYFSAGVSDLFVTVYIFSLILLYLKKPQKRFLILLLYIPAVFFKETAILIPLILFLVDWWREKINRNWLKKMWAFFIIMLLQIVFKFLWMGSGTSPQFSSGKLINFFISIIAHIVVLISSPGFQVARLYGYSSGIGWIMTYSIIFIALVIAIIRGRIITVIKKHRTFIFSLAFILINLLPAVFYLHFGYNISKPLSISAGRQFFLPYFGLVIFICWFLKYLWKNKSLRFIALAYILIFYISGGIWGHLSNVDRYVKNGRIYKSLLSEIERAREDGKLNIVVVGTGEAPTSENLIYGDKDIFMYKVFFKEKDGTYRHAQSISEAEEMLEESGGRIIVWKRDQLIRIIDI
jgi:hypothetical protein